MTPYMRISLCLKGEIYETAKQYTKHLPKKNPPTIAKYPVVR